jgi:hypothetical protein
MSYNFSVICASYGLSILELDALPREFEGGVKVPHSWTCEVQPATAARARRA